VPRHVGRVARVGLALAHLQLCRVGPIGAVRGVLAEVQVEVRLAQHADHARLAAHRVRVRVRSRVRVRVRNRMRVS